MIGFFSSMPATLTLRSGLWLLSPDVVIAVVVYRDWGFEGMHVGTSRPQASCGAKSPLEPGLGCPCVAVLVWCGHSCPLPLTLISIFFVCTTRSEVPRSSARVAFPRPRRLDLVTRQKPRMSFLRFNFWCCWNTGPCEPLCPLCSSFCSFTSVRHLRDAFKSLPREAAPTPHSDTHRSQRSQG